MDFHLSFPIKFFPQKLNYSHKSLFIGSCFAENICDLMNTYKFSVVQNPHGILYNPASIAIALRRYINKKLLQEADLFYFNECWNSPEHHSRFSNKDRQNCLTTINNKISSSNIFLRDCDWLFITFGSSYVYKDKQTGEMVGNCHKRPQQAFTKLMLSASEVILDYTQLIQEITEFNRNIKIVFTISPVRHIRDGVIENSLSKARLIEAVHELVKLKDNIFYFPAYEIVLDDLRDYRFFKADLIHPNEQAISYVFEKIMEAIFDEESKLLFEKIKEIIMAKQHRPFNINSESYNKFKAFYESRILQLQLNYPNIKFEDDIQ